jgi:DNA-binding response OmpR family regulator
LSDIDKKGVSTVDERTLEQTKAITILAIDDEPYLLRALSYLLTREGYTVETASDGAEGIAKVQALRPQVVFLDIMMPVLNGYDVCQRIREDPTLAKTYVIMLSAKGQQVDRERGLLGGADEYMTKPFSPREIAQRLRTLIANGKIEIPGERIGTS